MNETIRQLFNRKSVRVFEQKSIDPHDKALILEAACMAPTAGNRQLYTIIDVTDQAIKEQLVHTCDHQPFIAADRSYDNRFCFRNDTGGCVYPFNALLSYWFPYLLGSNTHLVGDRRSP